MTTSSFEPIGGYFELGIGGSADSFLHDDGITLNSGRTSFEYILRANTFTHVYLPKFTCDVMLEPLERLGIPYTFYSITNELELANEPSLGLSDCLVYTNYFGLKDAYSEHLRELYGSQLIIDASQAYYMSPLSGCHTFYSPRKFFGLPDGGIAYTTTQLTDDLEVDISYDRFSHLIKRIDLGAEVAYTDFQADDQALVGQPIKRMSRLTRTLLGGIDFADVRRKRMVNYSLLADLLSANNQAAFISEDNVCPMYYPYITNQTALRERLIAEKIFVPKYWPNVLTWTNDTELEYQLTETILPLPIDQRYSASDMQRIVDVIKG